MYLRRCYRNKDGKRHAYWALVESYRTVRGPRQRVVAWLGELDTRGRLAIRQQGAEDGYQRGLFEDEEPEWIEVDLPVFTEAVFVSRNGQALMYHAIRDTFRRLMVRAGLRPRF